jgi:hypothetical protein
MRARRKARAHLVHLALIVDLSGPRWLILVTRLRKITFVPLFTAQTPVLFTLPLRTGAEPRGGRFTNR